MAIPKTTYKGSVYLSGPIAGLNYEQARYGWRATVATQLHEGITVLSPMRHEGHLAEVKGALDPAGQLDHFFSGARIIFEKDLLDIERSDIVLVNLLGATRVSIGTVAEIGMAAVLGKKIILVMEDPGNWEVPFDVNSLTSLADKKEGVKRFGDNPHEHPFVTVPASLRLNNLDDAIEAINSLLSEGI